MLYMVPVRHLGAILVIKSMSRYPNAYVQVALILHNNSPKMQEYDAGNLEMSKRSHKVLSFSEKMKILNLIRKEKNYMLKFLRFKRNINLLSTK